MANPHGLRDDNSAAIARGANTNVLDAHHRVHRQRGDGWANGAPRPSFEQIRLALQKGQPFRRPGNDGIVFDYKGVRVIINENNPFKSTGFFSPGR